MRSVRTARVRERLRPAVLLAVLAMAASARADNFQPPPAPAHYFNDYAHLVSPDDGERLEQKLKTLDERSGNQVVVAIFPEIPEGTYLEDFTVRTAQAWRVGQKKLDNGAVLFVFVKDHKTRLEVGYGLEGQIPDVVAKRILQDYLSPQFKQGQYARGIDAAIEQVYAAVGAPPGQAAREAAARRGAAPADDAWHVLGTLLFIAVILFIIAMSRRGGGGGWYTGGWYGGGGGWSGGGGGWSGGGGGGFSGGGGSFGGGGASGDW
jgi:uncharacterized protein